MDNDFFLDPYPAQPSRFHWCSSKVSPQGIPSLEASLSTNSLDLSKGAGFPPATVRSHGYQLPIQTSIRYQK